MIAPRGFQNRVDVVDNIDVPFEAGKAVDQLPIPVDDFEERFEAFCKFATFETKDDSGEDADPKQE